MAELPTHAGHDDEGQPGQTRDKRRRSHERHPIGWALTTYDPEPWRQGATLVRMVWCCGWSNYFLLSGVQ